ncbi:hypothetical protein [Desulfosarcina widdelii]|uniref:hypothetical protein n=1 Tax=Desulfosarcina widdelii TaxID=947919 RepID=UPI0012D34165|nr:hypothetical protein [Desulfosarcina widdelii]
MNLKKILILAAVFNLAFFICVSFAEVTMVRYPSAVNPLYIDDSKSGEYENLANSIGLSTINQYSYTEFADANRSHNTGAAGQYEWLLLSTGGNENDLESLQRYNKERCGWKMEYYSNHDITMIFETCSDDSRSRSFVRILKLCKGKNPNLHLQ